MKNSITVLFLFINVLFCHSQQLTEQEYDELSDLFATDVELMSGLNDEYENIKLKSGLSYTHSTVYELPENTATVGSIDKILIIVNSSIYSQVEDKIKRYGYDLNYIYGCEVIMEQVSGSDHGDIKDLILSEATDLDEVVLIGDIPAGWYEVANDFGKYGHAEWPCDLYYMDTDGT